MAKATKVISGKQIPKFFLHFSFSVAVTAARWRNPRDVVTNRIKTPNLSVPCTSLVTSIHPNPQCNASWCYWGERSWQLLNWKGIVAWSWLFISRCSSVLTQYETFWLSYTTDQLLGNLRCTNVFGVQKRKWRTMMVSLTCNLLTAGVSYLFEI